MLSIFVHASCSCVELLLVPVGAILLGMRIFLSGSHTWASSKYPRNLSRLSSNGASISCKRIGVVYFWHWCCVADSVAIGSNVFDDNQHQQYRYCAAKQISRTLPIFRTKHSHILNGYFLDLFIGGFSRQSQSYGISILFGKFSTRESSFSAHDPYYLS